MASGRSWQSGGGLGNQGSRCTSNPHITEVSQQLHVFSQIFVSLNDLSAESGYININMTI